MTQDPASLAFLAYQRTGHPGHLAEVFDRTATELHLVAAHLLPAGGDVADVVQRTYLTAIARRRRYDGHRPIGAWLTGILVRHVQHERRRLRRRPDGRRLPVRTPSEPPDLAAAHELAERVRDAVADLPQPYRHVLRLHLVHGLSLQEIAGSLERPYRTVQSQLRRGLGMLRQVLPGTVLVAAAKAADPAAVRNTVLAAARPTATASAPWLALAAAGVLLAPLGTAWVAAEPEKLVTAAGEPSPDIPGGRAGPTLATLRRPVVPRTPQDPEATCQCRLRLAAAEDGVSLPEAGVTVRIQATDRVLLPRVDARGIATFEVPRDLDGRMEITVRCADRQVLAGSMPVPDREAFDLGELRLRRLVPGRLRVCDPQGTPLPYLAVHAGTNTPPPFAPTETGKATTDREGRTPVMDLPRGAVTVTLRGVPVAFACGPELCLQHEVRGGEQALVVPRPAPRDVIAGRVVDDDGDPVAGAWVQLVRDDGMPLVLGAPGRQPARNDGRFALHVPGDEEGPFRILAGLGRRAGRLGADSWERGTEDAIVRLAPPPPGILLHVVAAEDGRPVEDFGVVCFRVHRDRQGWISGDTRLRLGGYHEEGTVFVEDVGPGHHRLLVLPPEDGPLLPSGYLPVDVDGTGHEVTVRLHRPAPIPVRIVDPEGNPIAGSRVRLLARSSEGHDDNRFVHDLRAPRFSSTHWGHRIELADASTDARGVAELPWQPWDEPVVVRAEGPGHVVRELDLPSVSPGGDAIVLRVARGATVRGTVAHLAHWPTLAVDLLGRGQPVERGLLRLRTVLRDASTGRIEAGADDRGFPIADGGTFVCAQVPPGRWQVLLDWNRPSVGIGTTVERLLRPLDEVVAIAGRTHEVEIDLDETLPGSLHGRVFLDGEPRRPESITYESFGVDHLGRPRQQTNFTSKQFVTDEGYRIDGVLPGEVRVDARIDGRLHRSFRRIPLAPGATEEVDLNFRRLVAALELVDPRGRPLPYRVARIAGRLHRSDAAGRIVLDPVPALRLEVEVYAPGVTRNELYTLAPDDPRRSPTPAATLDVDPDRDRSQFVVTVR